MRFHANHVWPQPVATLGALFTMFAALLSTIGSLMAHRNHERNLLARSTRSFLIRGAAKDDSVRIVDESGEDYLYHKSHFLFVDFPRAVTKRILALEQTS